VKEVKIMKGCHNIFYRFKNVAGKRMNKSVEFVFQIILLALLLGYVGLYYLKVKLPFYETEKSALSGLLILGFIMCTFGIAVQIPHISWNSVFMVLAAIIGIFLLFIFVLNVFKIDSISEKFNFENKYGILFQVVALLMTVKWVITFIHHIVLK
jgi:hypothetical protein